VIRPLRDEAQGRRREPCQGCRRLHRGKATPRCYQHVTPDGAVWMPESDCCFKNYVRLLISLSSGNERAGREHARRAAS
jgi:hypothetical protein